MGEKELPEGWVWTTLGDIVETVNPGFPTGQHNSEGKGVPHLRPMNITIYGEIDLNVIRYVESRGHLPLKKGDILFNNTNSPDLVGKTAIIEDDTNWAFSNHMTRIKFPVGLAIPEYFSRYLHFLFLEGVFKENSSKHVNQASISRAFLVNLIKVPLPPLAVQQRITEKLDKLTGYLKDARTALEEVPGLLKAFQQKMLDMAVKGELIPNNHSVKKIKLEEIANVVDPHPSHRTPPVSVNGIPYIGMGDISNEGVINFEDARKVSKEILIEHKARYTLRPGDFIFGKIGTIGKPVLLPSKQNYTISPNVLLIQPNAEIVDPEFLYFYVSSIGFKEQVNEELRSALQPLLGIKKMKKLTLNIPDKVTQVKIVQRIKHFFSIVESVRLDYERAYSQLESLPQAILANVFIGRLIDPISTHEDAKMLLERIVEEKSKIKEEQKKVKLNFSQKVSNRRKTLNMNDFKSEIFKNFGKDRFTFDDLREAFPTITYTELKNFIFLSLDNVGLEIEQDSDLSQMHLTLSFDSKQNKLFFNSEAPRN